MLNKPLHRITPTFRQELPVVDDPLRGPHGIVSGMTKRLAISDGCFCDVGNMPPDSKTSGGLRTNRRR